MAGAQHPSVTGMNERTLGRIDLILFDADYREILSTVSSLGSSIYAFKVQRYAITVALISIVLAAIALVPGESWSAVWAWISSAWS